MFRNTRCRDDVSSVFSFSVGSEVLCPILHYLFVVCCISENLMSLSLKNFILPVLTWLCCFPFSERAGWKHPLYSNPLHYFSITKITLLRTAGTTCFSDSIVQMKSIFIQTFYTQKTKQNKTKNSPTILIVNGLFCILYLADEHHLFILSSSWKHCASWTSHMLLLSDYILLTWVLRPLVFPCHSQMNPLTDVILTADILTCHSRKNAGGTNNRNDVSFPVITSVQCTN